MELELGKLFVGGISWDTDEDRLKEYFERYGEVVEAVIMKDRTTGRARGFGFIVFTDPSVAEKVVMEKHMIDGRNVEAKKAVPRDDHQTQNRNISGSIHGSPGPGSTKKIFVGGLASTVTETAFKTYFDQFGIITDVVVMYDHNTQRPRGFGFITFDSEEAVDRVLHKTFHELNGKMVEVKRAVPKELSPGPSRSPMLGLTHGFSRASSLLNNYIQGYNMSPGPGPIGGYGVRMDGRFNPISSGRSGYSPFGTSNYGLDMSMELGLTPGYGGGSNLSTNNYGYGRIMSPYHSGNSNRYNTPIGYNVGNGRNESSLASINRSVWGNGSLNNAPNPNSISPIFGNYGSNSGFSSILYPNVGHSSVYPSGNFDFGNGGDGYGLGEEGGYGRNIGVAQTPSFVSSSSAYDGSFRDTFRGGSVYGDSAWGNASSDVDGYDSFRYGLNNAASDVTAKNSEDFIGNYSVTNRQTNREIAT